MEPTPIRSFSSVSYNQYWQHRWCTNLWISEQTTNTTNSKPTAQDNTKWLSYINVKKGTTGPVQARKACWGSGSTAPLTLNLSMEWGLAVISTPRSLYPQGKWSQSPLNRRQEGPTIRLYTFEPSRNQTTIFQSPSLQPCHYTNSTNKQRYYLTRL